MNIHLHIDRLVLEGVAIEAMHVPQVQAAIEAELTRTLSEAGVPHRAAGARAASIQAMELFPDEPAAALGQRIGQAVYRGVVQ